MVRLSRYRPAPCIKVDPLIRLGQLRPKDVPGVLDTIVKQASSMDLTRTPLITHWRGRMGLSKEEQLERYLFAS
jgi:hypothetical protein